MLTYRILSLSTPKYINEGYLHFEPSQDAHNTHTDRTHLHIVTCISVAREQQGKHIAAKKNSWPKTGKGLSIVKQRACKQPSGGCLTTISDVDCWQRAVNKFLQQ
jgi:hypothetical protein